MRDNKEMELIVDLHVHSHYSYATSKNSNLEGLYRWGKIKGIHIIGTGDFTHPLWFAELKEKLQPSEDGLYTLREDIAQQIDQDLPETVKNNPLRFILTTEVSNIYKKNDKSRRIHNLIVSPNFSTAEKINKHLGNNGNLIADGRPILSLDSKELLKISLSASPETLFIPAHIWTPWFGLFGSKSGFNSLHEAFEELTPEIKAIETGLSSDPDMNWGIEELKNLTITSNSDAHSPQRLGREANIINAVLSYRDIISAIKTNDNRFKGTIEFFPQEGKYFLDGHRNCNFKCTPKETKRLNGICPVCHQKLTVGVSYRVKELENSNNKQAIAKKQVDYIIPLSEILAEISHTKSATKKVQQQYMSLIAAFGDEFSILRHVSTHAIRSAGFIKESEALDKMRNKDISIDPGFDGIYGKVKVYTNPSNASMSL